MTNYEKIKNMTIKEMAEFLADIAFRDAYSAYFNGAKECKKWLESEVEK